jgi:hypothetical protein
MHPNSLPYNISHLARIGVSATALARFAATEHQVDVAAELQKETTLASRAAVKDS